jgi:hypothetical protein
MLTNGAGCRRLAQRPEAKRQGAKSSGKIVFDAVNLTRWSFCFRKQTPTLGGWGVVVAEDDPLRQLKAIL